MTRRLHIGGEISHPDWEIFNTSEKADHRGNAKDLSRFKTNSIEAIYASHILEHFDYKGELSVVLREWYRVLVPAGVLYISVPDLDVLASLFISPKLSLNDRYIVMRFIFGGHMNDWDHHKVGLNKEILSVCLEAHDFFIVEQVADFKLFKDTSIVEFHGVPISLNLICRKGENHEFQQV